MPNAVRPGRTMVIASWSARTARIKQRGRGLTMQGLLGSSVRTQSLGCRWFVERAP